MLGTSNTYGELIGRDHAELPDDFEERAAEIEETHRSNPVKEELRGMFCRIQNKGPQLTV